MKHVIIVILLGAIAGAASHALWYSFRRPPAIETQAQVLAWLREDLQLTDEQFDRVKAIHERSGPELAAMSQRAARLRAELAAFEERRQTIGEIDFLAFARFVEQQREFDRHCLESTRELIAASASEMSSDQRARYLDRFDPTLRPPSGRLN
jgi:capsule polysaccharide export protein KpsE/RkpR